MKRLFPESARNYNQLQQSVLNTAPSTGGRRGVGVDLIWKSLSPAEERFRVRAP